MSQLIVLIKNIDVKSLVSGDSEIEVILRGRLNKKGLKELIDIYDAQEEIIAEFKRQ